MNGRGAPFASGSSVPAGSSGTSPGRRVGIILSQPFGYSLGTDVHIRGLAAGFRELGVEVHVYVPYRTSAPDLGPGAEAHVRDTPHGSVMEMAYRWTRRFSNHPILAPILLGRRALVEASVRNVLQFMEERLDPDAFDLLIAEQEFAALAAERFLAPRGVPYMADYQGVWADEAVAAGLLRRDSARYRYLRSVEATAFLKPPQLLVVSEEMKQYLVAEYSVPPDRIVVTPPGAFARLDRLPVRPAPPKVIWSGTVTPRENIDLFLRALPTVLTEFPDLQVHITDRGDGLDAAKRTARHLGLRPHYFYLERYKDFLSLMASCHVGILTSSDDPFRRMSYPAKLFDYLSVGLPVVANNIGGWSRIVEEYRVGLLTESKPEDFAQALIRILRDPGLQRTFGENGIRAGKGPLSYVHAAETVLAHGLAIRRSPT